MCSQFAAVCDVVWGGGGFGLMNSFLLMLWQPLSLPSPISPLALSGPSSVAPTFAIITILWWFRGMETGIKADNMWKCGCLCILSNFLNVLKWDVPEIELSNPSFISLISLSWHGYDLGWILSFCWGWNVPHMFAMLGSRTFCHVSGNFTSPGNSGGTARQQGCCS